MKTEYRIALVLIHSPMNMTQDKICIVEKNSFCFHFIYLNNNEEKKN